jgi:DNA-binding response OmpR family regulator
MRSMYAGEKAKDRSIVKVYVSRLRRNLQMVTDAIQIRSKYRKGYQLDVS